MEISILQLVSRISIAFLSLEKKIINQTFGVTDMRSPQQTNSILRNKTATLTTQKMGV